MRVILLFLVFLSTAGYSQISLKDSAVGTIIVGLDYRAALPGSDLSDRWGFSNQLGGTISYKFRNSMTLGLSGGFIFGNDLRDTSIFSNVLNSYGQVISLNGNPADVLLLMRGASGYVTAGYVFNKWGNNPNSGVWVNFGAGFLMHKIRIESLYDDVPQLEGEYRKGYDKLSVGFSTKQFIGYLYQADYRLLKFYAGFEFAQGFTKNIRTYNFDTGGPENDLRLDMMYGFKVGWIVPIAKRSPNEFFYD